jgi:hypothetical protein
VVDKLPLGDRLTVVHALGPLAFFSPRNLTGAYHLRLHLHAERCVAQQLLAASVEEGEWRTDARRGVNWRNAQLDGSTLPRATLLALDTFTLPEVPLSPLSRARRGCGCGCVCRRRMRKQRQGAETDALSPDHCVRWQKSEG